LSLASQGSRLALSRRASTKTVQIQRFDESPVTTYTGADNTTVATSSTTITSRRKITADGTLQTIGLNILSGSPTVARVYCTVILEDENDLFKSTLCRGYIYPGHSPWGAGGIGVKFGDQIRLETRSSLAGVIIRPIGSILKGIYAPGGWTGTDESSLEGRGRVHLFSTSDPSAGDDWDETVPAGRIWRVDRGIINFTTDANPGTRSISLEIQDNSALRIWKDDSWGTLTNTTTAHEIFFVNTSHSDTSGPDRTGYHTPILMDAGWHIKTNHSNWEAGDDLQAGVLHVEEWISP